MTNNRCPARDCRGDPERSLHSVATTMPLSHHRDLALWRQGVALALEADHVSRRFPHEEMYGLTSQLRRAATAIPSNVAEGNGRAHRREYANFVSMARGSLREVETLLEIACGLEYTSEEE